MPRLKGQVPLSRSTIESATDEAVAMAAHSAGSMIKGLTKADHGQISLAVADAIEEGWTEARLAKRVRQVVGLGAKNMQAVDNYRAALINKGMSPAKARREADAYATRLAKQRAAVIAQHEVRKALADGLRATWEEQQELGELSSHAVKVWRTHPDEKRCPTCKNLNGRKSAIRGGTYVSKAGGVLVGPPAHPNCRCHEVVVDRGIVKSDGTITDEEVSKGQVKRVRTPAGVRFYGLPIGAPITPGVAGRKKHRAYRNFGHKLLSDAEAQRDNPHQKYGVKYKMGDHPTDEAVTEHAEQVRSYILSHYIDWKSIAEDEEDFDTGDMESDEDFVSSVAASMKYDAAHGDVSMMVPGRLLTQILEEGRIKSQFETNTSGGLLDQRTRAMAEARWGPTVTTKAKDRPVYGFIQRPGEESIDYAGHYGNVQIVFKKDVRKRTTVTFGDSLNHDQQLAVPIVDLDTVSDDRFLASVGTSATAPYAAMNVPVGDDDMGDPFHYYDFDYIEAQIHGGLPVSDIEEVVIRGTTWLGFLDEWQNGFQSTDFEDRLRHRFGDDIDIDDYNDHYAKYEWEEEWVPFVNMMNKAKELNITVVGGF